MVGLYGGLASGSVLHGLYSSVDDLQNLFHKRNSTRGMGQITDGVVSTFLSACAQSHGCFSSTCSAFRSLQQPQRTYPEQGKNKRIYWLCLLQRVNRPCFTKLAMLLLVLRTPNASFGECL